VTGEHGKLAAELTARADGVDNACEMRSDQCHGALDNRLKHQCHTGLTPAGGHDDPA
jgi:hypothetical protein